MPYSLPPWLSVTPQDFLAATQAGAQLGKSISDSAQRAWEEQARMQMAAQAQEKEAEQRDFENRLRQTEMNAALQDRARKSAAQQAYSSAVSGGEDPARALLRLSPQLGESLTGAAQLYKSTLPQKQTPPASPIGKLMYDKQRALESGAGQSVIDSYDAAIAESSTNKGTRVYMGQDDQGRPIFQMATGGAAPIGTPTVATQTLAQGRQLQYQNATELMNWLERNLKPEHVGVAGKTGEFVVDKALAQILPDVANKERISARATLDMAQGLAREIVDSPSGRFSNVERDAILGALPSTGFIESYPDAVARLERAKEVLRSRGKVYSTQLGQQVPTWALSKDEIKDRFQRGRVSGLKPDDKKFKESGFLTEDEALDALQRFH